MQDLEKILTKFEQIVSPNFCHDLAKRTRLIQRSTSKIKGHEFAQSMMIPHAFLDAETLNSLSVRMSKINNECNLSASALSQRMNTIAAVSFMKACFGTVLKEIVKTEFINLPDLPNLAGFNRILIQDSTMIELHEKLSLYFKGRGGAASKSAIKIDYVFDYLSEQIVEIDFFSGNIPDQSLANRINPILKEGDLVIRDLGYYALDRIKEIEQKKAFYNSRLKSNIDVYENKEDLQPLDLAKFLELNLVQGIVDCEVFIGKEKYPVRLVACLMNEEAINKRKRDANRNAQRCGRKTSKKKLNLLNFSIFITNIPIEIFCSTSIMSIYRARWRIELIFKQWKSCLKIHIFQGYNIKSFHCLLFGRLIMILLLGSIYPFLMQYAFILRRELSCFKLTNYLIADHAFAIAIIEGKTGKFIDQLLQDLPRRLCMDKRKRCSLRKNVRFNNSYYKPLDINELKYNVA